MIKAYGKFVLPTQCGGICGRGTDTAMHIARMHWQWAQVHEMSAAQVYIDVVSAFATLHRALVVCLDRSDASLARIAATFGLPAEALHEVVRIISAPDALQQLEVSAHARCPVAASGTHTWVTVQGSSDLHMTSRGTKAGYPIGYLLFTVALTRVLRELRDTLRAEGLSSSLPLDPRGGPFSGLRAAYAPLW